MPTFQKDPEAVLDYAFDWSGAGDSQRSWLAAGETIISYTVTAGSGLVVDSDSETAGVVTVWLSAGTAGAMAQVECLIATSGGRTDERTANILVRER